MRKTLPYPSDNRIWALPRTSDAAFSQDLSKAGARPRSAAPAAIRAWQQQGQSIVQYVQYARSCHANLGLDATARLSSHTHPLLLLLIPSEIGTTMGSGFNSHLGKRTYRPHAVT